MKSALHAVMALVLALAPGLPCLAADPAALSPTAATAPLAPATPVPPQSAVPLAPSSPAPAAPSSPVTPSAPVNTAPATAPAAPLSATAAAEPAAPLTATAAAAPLSATAPVAATAPDSGTPTASALSATAAPGMLVGPAPQADAAPPPDPTAAVQPTTDDSTMPPLPTFQPGGPTAPGADQGNGAGNNGIPADLMHQPKMEAKEHHFKLNNFLLGFGGGVLIGGTLGLLTSNSNNMGTRSLDAVIGAGAVGLGFGTLALFLGATTVEPARPPQVEGRLPLRPELTLAYRF